MQIRYEYGFMFHTIDISQVGDINSEHGASLFGQELAELTQGLNESLPQFDGGNWEILSHNINFTGLVAMISFLIRRPAQQHKEEKSK
jgi:hypothetical protein